MPDYWENLRMSNIYLDLGQFEESNEKLLRSKRILEKMEGSKKFEIQGVDNEMFRVSLKMREINFKRKDFHELKNI